MKVMQLLPSLDVGGVERGVIDLVHGLSLQGEGSVVVSSGGALVKELEKIGVPHYELPVHEKSLASLFLIPKLVEIIRREQVDIIHARSRVPAWLGYFAARQAGISFVTTCHGYYSEHLLSRVMGWGRRVIVISRVIARHMIDDFRVPTEKIRLIHRGVDLSQFQSIDPVTVRRASDRPFRIICVGRLSPIKGQVEFLHALHLLKTRIPQIEAWIVGSEGGGKTKYTELLRQTVERLGLSSQVKMMGTRRDIPNLIRESDLLVLATKVPEAFGRVIVEAGAVGRPVIATRLGGILDIIESGTEGILVTPGDSQELADAMERMIRNPEEAAKMARALQQKVRSYFTLEQMIQKTKNVYDEVRAEKKILVIKLGAMGDLILITPSLRMIRERFPKAHITLLVDRKLAPLVDACPYLDAVILADRKHVSSLSGMLQLAKKIRTEGFDVSVDFQNSKWTHLLAYFSGIPKRYGFDRGWTGRFLNFPDRTFGVPEAPVRQQFRILTKLGVRDYHEELELWPPEAAKQKVQRILQDLPGIGPNPRIGLFVGASPRWLTKRWPLEAFRELAERLRLENGARIFLLGGGEDQQAVEDVFGRESSESWINLVGQTSLQDLQAWIAKMDVVVTGDTAPLHIASALNRRIVAIFGPTDPKRHMPPGNHPIVLCKSLPCQPCYQGTCKNVEMLACLKKITVAEVLESVQRQMQAAKTGAKAGAMSGEGR